MSPYQSLHLTSPKQASGRPGHGSHCPSFGIGLRSCPPCPSKLLACPLLVVKALRAAPRGWLKRGQGLFLLLPRAHRCSPKCQTHSPGRLNISISKPEIIFHVLGAMSHKPGFLTPSLLSVANLVTQSCLVFPSLLSLKSAPFFPTLRC